MTKTRAFASFTVATAVTGSALSLTMAMPTAHADPLDNIRGAVNGARAQSTCPALAYSSQLERAAQIYARNGQAVPSSNPQGYVGTVTAVGANADPTAKATSIAVGDASPYIRDCKYKDYGVGMFRDDNADDSRVTIVLGQPPAPAQQPQQPPPNQAPPQPAPVPAPAPAPAPPVTNAIQLSFGPPHLGSITATVANSSDLTAKCTYDSTPFNNHRDFTVNPKGSNNLTFSGFNTGTSYHVVVSCHDASGKQTQEIGHAETNVTF